MHDITTTGSQDFCAVGGSGRVSVVEEASDEMRSPPQSEVVHPIKPSPSNAIPIKAKVQVDLEYHSQSPEYQAQPGHLSVLCPLRASLTAPFALCRPTQTSKDIADDSAVPVGLVSSTLTIRTGVAVANNVTGTAVGDQPRTMKPQETPESGPQLTLVPCLLPWSCRSHVAWRVPLVPLTDLELYRCVGLGW